MDDQGRSKYFLQWENNWPFMDTGTPAPRFTTEDISKKNDPFHLNPPCNYNKTACQHLVMSFFAGVSLSWIVTHHHEGVRDISGLSKVAGSWQKSPSTS